MDREAEIEALLDKQALHDNLMRYCRALDRMDRDGIAASYWPDGFDDHGSFRGSGSDWADEAVRWKHRSWQVNHHVSNVLIDLDGARARRESMFVVVCEFKEGRLTSFLGGRYRDLCEKRDGEWRVRHRVCIWDWSQVVPTERGWHLTGQPETTHWGAYFPDDPIYQDWGATDARPYPRNDAAFTG